MPFRPKAKQPQFADLKGILAQSKDTDNALYQTVQILIERLGQFQTVQNGTIDELRNIISNTKTDITVVGGGPGGLEYLGAYVPATTYNDGDFVIGPDGITYVCVKDGTTTPPEPWPACVCETLHPFLLMGA